MAEDQPTPTVPEGLEEPSTPERHDFGVSPAERDRARKMFETASQAIERRNYGYAISLLRQAVRLVPTESRYRQALRATARKKFNEAGGRPKFAIGFLFWPKSWIARLKKNWPGLIEICEDMLVKNPWHVGAQRALGAALFQTGLVEDAVQTLQSVVHEKPNHVGALRQLGTYYQKHGDFNEAIRCWQKISELRPNDRDAATTVKNLSAHETIHRARLEEADSFKESVRDEAETQRLLDEEKVLKSRDQVDERIQELEIQIDAEPSNANLYYELAKLYEQTDRGAQAEEVLKRAQQQGVGGFETHMRLADIQARRLRREAQAARQTLMGDPENQALRSEYKQARKRLLDFELDEYAKRVQQYPTELNWRFEYGRRLLQAGQYQEAITQLQRARNAPKHRPQALQLLGRCFFHLGNADLALEHLQQALEALPAGADDARKAIHYELMRVAEHRGDREAYVKHLNVVAGLDFDYRDVAQRMQRLGKDKQVTTPEAEEEED